MNPAPDTRLATLLRERRAVDEYTRGALDVLALLGLVDVSTAAPPSELAALALDALAAHLADGVPAALDTGLLRPPEVLRAVETARMARVERPTPSRTVRVVGAVIKRRRPAGDEYLMQYDAPAGWYQPPGGKVEPGESEEAALHRELAEELDLHIEPAVLARLEPAWETQALSATYGVLTAYVMDFFHVQVSVRPIGEDALTRWLNVEEIEAGQAQDGRPISRVLVEAVGRARLDALADTQGA